MNLYQELTHWLKSVIHKNDMPEALWARVVVEPTKDATHGHIATNAALIMAKSYSLSPRALATQWLPLLQQHPDIQQVDIAGPGFINLTFAPRFWPQHLQRMLEQGKTYGQPLQKPSRRHSILVEFVSVNPTGPLHAGHGRNAILGDTLANLLQFYGYIVQREYYINDAGGQVDALARSVYLRYCEAAGQTLNPDDFTADMYRGDYLISVGQQLYTDHGNAFVDQPESAWLPLFRDTAVNAMMTAIKDDLAAAGVMMDTYVSERALIHEGLLQEALDILTNASAAYVGTVAAPKGVVVEDWEAKPQTLFRATAYGDDVDRVLKKSDNSWTYFAGDAAYHLHKIKRGFHHLINVFGADHAGYLKRLKAVTAALGQSVKPTSLEINVTQMVNFIDQGVAVRMSKRAGTFITLRDVVQRVGVNATRFMLVSRHQDSPIDFDFAAVVEMTKDNPIFYINYAYARIHSVFRHWQGLHNDNTVTHTGDFSTADMRCLTDDAERLVIQALCGWPRVIEAAVHSREPHRLASALLDIASCFHSLWNKGKDNTQLRFIDPDNAAVTYARLALIAMVARVIESGLGILGIQPAQEMGHQDDSPV